MGKRGHQGDRLETLLSMAIPLLQEAEQRQPRTGRGAKPIIPDWVIGALIMVAVLKRKKTKSAQFRFITDPANRARLAAVLQHDHFPSRSRWFDRYRRAALLFQAAIKLQGERAIAEGVADPRAVAIDKSLIPAQGPPWHQRDRQRKHVPPGVDQDGAWGYSEHDGWVYGFSYEVVVTATRNTVVFPLLASVDIASAAEARTCVEKLKHLPTGTKYVALDSGYDANALAEQVEWQPDGRGRTGRRYLCPQNPRNSGRPAHNSHQSQRQLHSRKLRQDRQAFFESPQGRQLYARRRKTVEPFNQWLKSLFELEHRVWHRGLLNTRTQLLAAIFVYQLLVRFNFRQGHRNACIRWLCDAL